MNQKKGLNGGVITYQTCDFWVQGSGRGAYLHKDKNDYGQISQIIQGLGVNFILPSSAPTPA